jgi:hypothetical protein
VLGYRTVREAIGIIGGETQYGMGTLMTVSLAAMMRDRGYATQYLDGRQTKPELTMLREANIVAILAFNGVHTHLRGARGDVIWDEAGIPCIAWLVDHPIYHLWRLSRATRLLVPACIDESHARFLGEWGLSSWSRELHHFALGDPERERPVDRDIDVLFPASVLDPEALRSEWSTLAEPLRRLIEESTAECLVQADADLVQIIARLCPEVGISDPASIGAAVGYVFVRADQYVRAQRRAEMLDALADAGIVVDQIGHGGLAQPAALRRHRVHGVVPASSLPAWFRRARTIVHAGLNFPAGSHERVFTAQRQGAVVMTEANRYWRGLLNDGVDGLLFEWDDLEAAPARLKDLLRNPDELERIACGGRQIAEDSIVRAGDEVVAAITASQQLRSLAN